MIFNNEFYLSLTDMLLIASSCKDEATITRTILKCPKQTKCAGYNYDDVILIYAGLPDKYRIEFLTKTLQFFMRKSYEISMRLK